MDALPSQELPPGWAWASVGALGSVTGGLTKNPKRASATEQLPYLRVANVQAGRLNLTEVKRIGVFSDELARGSLLPDDLLIVEGNGSADQIGRCAIWSGAIAPCFHQNHLIRVRMPEPALARWTLYWLLSARGRASIEAVASSTSGLHTLSISKVSQLAMPVAPIGECERVVTAIEDAFEELEAGEAALTRAREGLTQFRASLLHAACTGALTADWRPANPTNETADELLKGALDLRKKLWPGRYEAPVTIAADMSALPVGWRWATLDQLAAIPARNGISVKGNPEPPGIAALRLDALQGEGLDFTRRRYIDIPANKAADLAIRQGDFLISRANGSLTLMGRACVAGIPPVPTVFPDTMIRFRLASADLARWAAVAWRSVFVREHLERRAKTSAGIWKISQDDMRSAPIPLPPSHEVTAILEALETAQVENGALPTDGFADALRQSILHAAFTGRLAAQDPADEPAAALLARLRAKPAAARRPRAHRTATQPDLIETQA